MKNLAESMPQSAKKEEPIASEEEIDSALEALDAPELSKEERKERAVQKALDELTRSLEKMALDSEIEGAFEGIKDAEAIEADAQVEAALQEQEGAEKEAAPEERFTIDVQRLGEAKLKNSMMEMVRSRTVDVVLENYKHDFAQKALFEEPFAAALASMGIPDADDPEKVAEALLRANTPGYEEMPPEMQATLRKTIGGMAEKVVADLREKWNADVVEIVRNKRHVYEDNQEQLQQARAEAAGDAKRLAEIDESLAINARLMESADSLISGFGV